MKSHFSFNRQERSGIFFLLSLIGLVCVAYILIQNKKTSKDPIFQLDQASQAGVDSLKVLALQGNTVKIFPFNPNFISDNKGYALGMSPEEIDRLHAFREKGNFVNSKEEFQQLTQVSDSLLNVIAPYFKFPDWAANSSRSKKNTPRVQKEVVPKILDLNKATAEQLKRINGIGENLSARIVKFRNRLGGFLVNEQLYDVYGLEPAVVERTLKNFQVRTVPEIKKININKASVQELATLIYLGYNVAENIVMYRTENGAFTSKEDLFNVQGFPINKIDRIALYLSF